MAASRGVATRNTNIRTGAGNDSITLAVGRGKSICRKNTSSKPDSRPMIIRGPIVVINEVNGVQIVRPQR